MPAAAAARLMAATVVHYSCMQAGCGHCSRRDSATTPVAVLVTAVTVLFCGGAAGQTLEELAMRSRRPAALATSLNTSAFAAACPAVLRSGRGHRCVGSLVTAAAAAVQAPTEASVSQAYARRGSTVLCVRPRRQAVLRRRCIITSMLSTCDSRLRRLSTTNLLTGDVLVVDLATFWRICTALACAVPWTGVTACLLGKMNTSAVGNVLGLTCSWSIWQTAHFHCSKLSDVRMVIAGFHVGHIMADILVTPAVTFILMWKWSP